MRALTVAAGALVALAMASGTALAQGRGHGHGREQAPGQAKQAERGGQEAWFGDRDRDLARNWYLHERGGAHLPPGLRRRELPPGLRDRDRLPPGLERRLERGYVVETDLRPRLHPVPVELRRRFAPPPPGYGYYALGGHILLLDAAFRISDVIRLEIGLAR